NLWAVRLLVALLVAGTGFCLFLAGRALRQAGGGLAAALLFAVVPATVLFQGDAYAANTEWFAAFFSSAAAAVFLGGGGPWSSRRILATGLLSGCAFLSKQPALLDFAAPLAALAYAGWRQSRPPRAVSLQVFTLAAGWLAPVLLAAAWFGAHGALRDGIFYTWTYNLTYYGPEITTAERAGALTLPFQIIGSSQPWLLLLWAGGALAVLHRLAQRNPAPAEDATNPGLLYLAVWSLAGLAGAASSGRGFDHYSIQFLAPFCLGAGLVLGRLA
ncbi:MAG: hypothetical protein ABUL61_05340, partial [Oleiharenicola lentus]